jgi:AraC family transcriptional regulator
MGSRIMVYSSGKARPLRFGAEGSAANCLVSATTRWAGLPIEGHRIQSFEGSGESGPVDGECGLLAILDGGIEMVVRRKGHEVRVPAPPGTTFLVTGQDRPNVVRMTGTADAVAVRFPREWFERLALHGVPAGFGQTKTLSRDVTVSSLVRAMRDEVARGAPTGRLYADSLSLALLAYVVEREPRCTAIVRGRLSEGECHRLRSYVNERLGEDLSLAELAAQVGRRPRHFSTLFRQAFGAPPYQYVLRQRLAEGARLLANGNADIAAIAYRLGFTSQSHFATAFRSAFGVAPRRYGIEKRGLTAVS